MIRMNSGRVWLRHLERVLLIVGLILVAIYALAKLHSQISAHLALRRFEEKRQEIRSSAQESVKMRSGETLDFSLWSDKRVQAYMDSLAAKNETPSGVLRIPKLRLQVPVYDGTDELTLNRGVGRIIGTVKLGEIGNTGIAGHRDGFFRGLKDIAPGDTVELMMPDRVYQYLVEKILITDPGDVSVLQPTSGHLLTLVTCYPFYYIGSAPQRYIVRASMADAYHPKDGPRDQSQAEVAKTNKKERQE